LNALGRGIFNVAGSVSMLSESWATRRDVSNNALRVIKFDEWIRNLIELQVTLKNALNYSE